MARPILHNIRELTNQRLPGVTSPLVVRMNAVLKLDDHDTYFRVGAEWIATRLANLIGLPVPPGALARHPDGRLGFVSLQFGDLDSNPPPVVLGRFAREHPQAAAGAAVFDLWIGNVDRNEANLAIDPVSASPILFDHGFSFDGGWRDRLADLPDRTTEPILTDTGLLQLTRPDLLGRWTDRIRRVDAELIDEVVDGLRQLGELSRGDANSVSDFLRKRREVLPSIVASCREDREGGELQ